MLRLVGLASRIPSTELTPVRWSGRSADVRQERGVISIDRGTLEGGRGREREREISKCIVLLISRAV